MSEDFESEEKRQQSRMKSQQQSCKSQQQSCENQQQSCCERIEAGLNVLELLPQQPPFVMIDRLTWFDEVFTRTQLRVREDNIFCENGLLTASGLIENIAQTCAARMGYINTYLVHDTVKLGFIGSIKNLVIRRCPRVGDLLDTEIEVVQDVMQMTLVNATIRCGDESLVTAEMKIAISDIDSQGSNTLQ